MKKALNDAFDAVDAPVLDLADLAGLAPEAWKDLRFQAHPSATRLDCSMNAAAVWKALKKGETPPDAIVEPSRLLIWRQSATPMFSELSEEEGMM